MTSKSRRMALWLLMMCAALVLGGCKQNPTQEQLYARMNAYFQDAGFQYACEPLEERPVPIYHSSAWQSLKLDGEEVMVYFDESNRADYLAAGIDASAFTFVGRFGLRFVLVYEGVNQRVLDVLNAMPEV